MRKRKDAGLILQRVLIREDRLMAIRRGISEGIIAPAKVESL